MSTVGSTIRAYRKVHETVEVCDHNEKHRVPWYAVKTLTVMEVRNEVVPFCDYLHEDSRGDVLYAVDAQGRSYRKEPHWDGPRATLWVLQVATDYGERVALDQYPKAQFARDAYGRELVIS